MARIRVEGYINTEDLPPEHVDLAHSTGLSEEGYTKSGYIRLAELDDLEFEVQKEET